jgi:hypothetical protein
MKPTLPKTVARILKGGIFLKDPGFLRSVSKVSFCVLDFHGQFQRFFQKGGCPHSSIHLTMPMPYELFSSSSAFALYIERFAYYCGFYFAPFRPSNSDFGYNYELFDIVFRYKFPSKLL